VFCVGAVQNAKPWQRRGTAAPKPGRTTTSMKHGPLTWPSELRASVSEGWFDSRRKFALFQYTPSRHAVIAFKEGNEEALAELGQWVLGTLPGIRSWLASASVRYIVSAPRHVVGGFAPGEAICAQLAAGLPGLEHLPGALVRTTETPSAYQSGADRLGVAAHLETIRYVGPPLNQVHPFGIILFDDVHTSGATSAACELVLRLATGCDTVLGLFLSRTGAQVDRPSPIIRRAP